MNVPAENKDAILCKGAVAITGHPSSNQTITLIECHVANLRKVVRDSDVVEVVPVESDIMAVALVRIAVEGVDMGIFNRERGIIGIACGADPFTAILISTKCGFSHHSGSTSKQALIDEEVFTMVQPRRQG